MFFADTSYLHLQSSFRFEITKTALNYESNIYEISFISSSVLTHSDHLAQFKQSQSKNAENKSVIFSNPARNQTNLSNFRPTSSDGQKDDSNGM